MCYHIICGYLKEEGITAIIVTTFSGCLGAIKVTQAALPISVFTVVTQKEGNYCEFIMRTKVN